MKHTELGGILDPHAATHGINPEFYVHAIEDTCLLCKRTYTTNNLDEDPFCKECMRKPKAEQERIHKDNMLGQGVRLQDRAAIPRKIGGTWSGGGIDTQVGRQEWEDAKRNWKKSYGITNPWAQRAYINRKILDEADPELL